MLRRIIGALCALLLASASAWGQGSVLQAGPPTGGHAPMYVPYGSYQTVIQDSGPASGGKAGLGLSELLGVSQSPTVSSGTGPLGTHACWYSAPVNSGAYYYLCFDPNAQGGGLIAYGNAGTAPALPLQFYVNGAPGTVSGNFSTATVTADTVTQTLAAWLGQQPFSVQAFGAACNGTTDDTAAFAAGFAVGNLTVPNAACYTASGITVPDGRSLTGVAYNPGSQTAPPGGSRILCLATITSACVTVGNSDSGTAQVSNLSIVRGAGTVPATAPCLIVPSAQNVFISEVECFNHAQGFQTSGGIYVHFNDVITCKISDSHVVINATPGVFFRGGTIGCVGSYDVAGSNYVKVTGNWDAVKGTIHFVDTQFNLGANQVNCAFSFQGFSGSSNAIYDFEVIGGHEEQAFNGVCTDSSVADVAYLQINDLWMEGGSGGANKLFNLNAATSIGDWELDGDHFTGWTSATLAPSGAIDDLKITGSSFADTQLSVTGTGTNSQIQLTGNTYQGVNLAGAFGFGSIVQGVPRSYGGGGTYNYTFTGPLQVEIVNESDYNNSSAIALKFGTSNAVTSALTSEYQLQGSLVTESIAFTLNGAQPSGTGTITGLPLASSSFPGPQLAPVYCSGISSGPIYASVEGGTTTLQFLLNGSTGITTAAASNFGSGSPTCSLVVTYQIQ